MGSRQVLSGVTSIEQGRVALSALVREIQGHREKWTEADTRFQFIDRFLTDCLGWPRDLIRAEVHQDRQFTDYELGKPRAAIWEAKREGVYFELPANPSRRLVRDLCSILLLSPEASDAIKQVQEYCASRGVQFAVACNGHQLVAFVATRNDGVAPLEGKCLVIDGYEALISEFPILWQNLSPAGVSEKRLLATLMAEEYGGIPPKPSSYLSRYPLALVLDQEHESLRVLADLIIEDVVHTNEFEEEFYKQCYCENGALAQHALVSHGILAVRYAALFDPSTAPMPITSVSPRKGELALTAEVIAEAISRRPLVLIGDVGVGKTSFLKHLQYVSAAAQFADSIYLYIDLGSKVSLADDLKYFVLADIERQLRERYHVDIYERHFVSGVYDLEVKRFERGIFGALKESDPKAFDKRVLAFLAERIDNKSQHLRGSVAHIVKARKKQLVVMIDNADQQTLDIQQRAFLIAQELAEQWSALVFVAIRPQTFHYSRRAGVLSAYSHRAFSVLPPRIDLVLEKRLDFALRMATGKISIPRLTGVVVNLEALGLFLEALLSSLKENTELVELLDNITGGNVRDSIELVKQFIGSPNVNVRKILETMHNSGRYNVSVHEFAKSVILGDYAHYVGDKSLALNVFDIEVPDPRYHFLVLMILGYLNHNGPHRTREGFTEWRTIIEEMQSFGFGQEPVETCLRRATNRKLIETTERITFEEDRSRLVGSMPFAFRITTIGAYHLNRWAGSFVYLDAMVWDTPMFDEGVLEVVRGHPDSNLIDHRYVRALAFRNYLSKVWREANLAPSYLDWVQLARQGQGGFDGVLQYIQRRDSWKSSNKP